MEKVEKETIIEIFNLRSTKGQPLSVPTTAFLGNNKNSIPKLIILLVISLFQLQVTEFSKQTSLSSYWIKIKKKKNSGHTDLLGRR